MIEILATGIVYRNPKPLLCAIHTWHPSLAQLDNGEIVASFDIAQAVEALDYHTVLSRSGDGGHTWTPPKPLWNDPPPLTTHSLRIGRVADGGLTAFGTCCRRTPGEPLVNPETLGFCPTDVLMMQSGDGGRTWDGPRVIAPPLVGPAFEVCHPIIELSDGRWLWPTSTWKAWNGDAPNGMKAIALVSRDRGRTWPEYLDVMDDYRNGVIHWEQSLGELPDGRLLAVAWAFHEPSGQTKPTPFAISRDGRAFSPPRPTGLNAQTAKFISLSGNRIVCVYRRQDKPGLWAAHAEVFDDHWKHLDVVPLWQGAGSGMDGRKSNAVELADLKFGFPSLILRPDGTVLVAFWCREDEINNVRWIRLRMT